MAENNKNIVRFDIESSEILDQKSDSRFMTVKLQVFSSGDNRHNMVSSEEALKKTASSIYGTPIIYNIINSIQDFGTHTDPKKSLMCGQIDHGSATFERQPDGRLSLFVTSKIMKRYFPDVISILKREDGFAKVSVEMDLLESIEREDGKIEMLNWEYYATCLLGRNVTEASPLAHLDVLSFAKENETFYKAYRLEFGNRYQEIDFVIPKKVKDNAKKALESHSRKEVSANGSYLAMARYLINNSTITPEKIRSVAKFFNKRTSSDEDVYMSFFGGSYAKKWSQGILSMMEDIDKKGISYFEAKDNAGEENSKEEYSMEDLEKEKDLKEEAEMALEKEKEKPEEEKKEEGQEQEPEKEEKEEDMVADFDYDSYFSSMGVEKEKFFSDGQFDHIAIHQFALGKMKELLGNLDSEKKEKEAFMAEFSQLKEYKESKEKAEFSTQIASIMMDVSEDVPEEELKKLQEDSVNYSLETVDAFKNKVKSIAYEFSKSKKEKNSDGINRFAISYVEKPKVSDPAKGWL